MIISQVVFLIGKPWHIYLQVFVMVYSWRHNYIENLRFKDKSLKQTPELTKRINKGEARNDLDTSPLLFTGCPQTSPVMRGGFALHVVGHEWLVHGCLARAASVERTYKEAFLFHLTCLCSQSWVSSKHDPVFFSLCKCFYPWLSFLRKW